jgi:hypothetical protein
MTGKDIKNEKQKLMTFVLLIDRQIFNQLNMKNIAYILLGIAGIMLATLLIWGILTLFSMGVNEKTLIILIFGGIACFGLIGRIIHVAKDSRK